jgi:hypothetical protein
MVLSVKFKVSYALLMFIEFLNYKYKHSFALKKVNILLVWRSVASIVNIMLN